MKEKFFITTPIYYTNGIPHIGHAYSSIICDVIFTYNKISGKDVKFSTGVDENSQKALDKAKEENMEITKYLDLMAGKHKSVWDGLKIKYTDFIRTTEERHHKLVREVLQKSFEKGDIYSGIYEGMYCVGCEAFKKDDDLIIKDGKKVCPDHLKTPEIIKEKNYFFKLSKYQKFLEDLYENNPNFVIPEDRYNEVKAFVKRGLEDFSISRETNKFGIKLPFDETQVTYVWYDALFNYVTVCQNGNEDFWPASLHVVGKDIIRFHAIYWPAMLKSAGYEMPKQILTTGFFTVDGQKISKSLGNVIDPVEFSNKYSKDLLTLYLLSSFYIGQDGDFDQKQALLMYNSKLANNLGNLVNRVIVLALKLHEKCGVLFPGDTIYDEIEEEFGHLEYKEENGRRISDFVFSGNILIAKELYSRNCIKQFNEFNLKSILDLSFSFLDNLNTYITEKEPWKSIKDESKHEETREVLYTVAEGLRIAGLFLYPFFGEKMSEMFIKLGLENYKERLENGELEALLKENPTFKIKEKGENLFERFEIVEEVEIRKEEDFKNINISVSKELKEKGIKVKMAILKVKNVSKRRNNALKDYINGVLKNLDIEEKLNLPIIKEGKKFYLEAGLENIIHPSENLLYLIQKSGNLPNINNVVDCYNIVAVETGVSTGVHDLSKINGDIHFQIATGNEKYIPLGGTQLVKVNPLEYISTDNEKVLCRMDIKQCDETKITLNTRDFIVYVQGNSAVDEDYLEKSLIQICENIKNFCDGSYKIL